MDAVSHNRTALFGRIPFDREAVVLLMTGITLFLCFQGRVSESVSEAGVLMNLPEILLGMEGTPIPVSEGEKTILPKDTEMEKKQYQSVSGRFLSAQIVLSGGEKRSIHRPEICLPAQGWTLESGKVIPVKLSNGKELEVMRLMARRPIVLKDGSKTEIENVFYYWFVGKNVTTPYHLRRILLTNLDMVLHNVNHRWAYVVVSAPVLSGLIPGGNDLKQTDAMLDNAVRELAPQIMKNP
jgi:hypothetical protein